MFYVTTSWDDGHVLDNKLSKLLDKHGVKGTFYVSKQYSAIGPQLSPDEIRILSERHEIGAHTLSHPDLRSLEKARLDKEIEGSKRWLEEILNKPVEMFCYPSGLYNEASVARVRKAGFIGARTTIWPTILLSTNSYEMPTTLPVYPLPLRKLAGNRIWWRKLLQPLFERYESFRALGVPLWKMYSWGSAARAAFDNVYGKGTVFHLWGHSWEIENYGLWGELDALLSYIASKPGVQFVTNGELIRIAQETSVTLGGESYGSWTVMHKGLTKNSVVYSFGVGEDISWEQAMIERFGLTVHAFDPTKRSFDFIQSQVSLSGFIFHPYGVGIHDGLENFYPPPNPKNISYSTVRKLGKIERLSVKRLRTIMRELGHDRIDLLKMDIEGGEYDVINDLIASDIRPKQILVEFHHRWSEVGIGKTNRAIAKLTGAGYRIFSISSSGEEYSFVR